MAETFELKPICEAEEWDSD